MRFWITMIPLTCTVIGVGSMMGKVLQCQREARARSSRGRIAPIISDGMLPWDGRQWDKISLSLSLSLSLYLYLSLSSEMGDSETRCWLWWRHLVKWKRLPLWSHLFHLAWSELQQVSLFMLTHCWFYFWDGSFNCHNSLESIQSRWRPQSTILEIYLENISAWSRVWPSFGG